MKKLIILSLLFPSLSLAAFKAHISNISLKVQKQIENSSMHPGCPVLEKDLRYITMSYWGFDNKSHQGELIVNKELSLDVVEIFKILYEAKFPIESMKLIDNFHASDYASMAANNTTAFNCREVTGQKGIYSQHSYGRAIDINPKINPYVGKEILPKSARKFKDRSKPYPGKITKTSLIYKLFIKHGWDWGGSWFDVQDYQHFEKRANGKKRNPYGYK